MHDDSLTSFIDRWTKSGSAERANYQLFLAGLCDVLEVQWTHPLVRDNSRCAYEFERSLCFD